MPEQQKQMYIAVVVNARRGPAGFGGCNALAHFASVKIALLMMKFRHICRNYVIARIMIPT